MLSNLNKIIKEFFRTLISVAMVGGLTWWTIVKAGSLTPSVQDTVANAGLVPEATSYTLENIYTRLNTNATSVEGDHSLATGSAPAATMHTLEQIYDLIPTIDPAKIVDGTTYLGVDGAIEDLADYSGSVTATSFAYTSDADGADTPGLEFLSETGYPRYILNTTLKKTEADLIASNIKDGVDLFGLTGTAAIGFGVVDTQGPLVDNEDGTLIDGNTGLVWQIANESATSFANAVALCAANDAPSLPGDNWHLPSVDEWKSILDFTASGSGVLLLSGETENQVFYTSDTNMGAGGFYGIVIGAELGSVTISDVSNSAGYVRICVRNPND